MSDTIEIENVRFAVLDRPLCVWSSSLQSTNLEFLRGVDPDFFIYQAKTHVSVLAQGPGKETALHAALALRLAYGAALESMFAFLGAVIQAPECVFGWLSSYKNHELEELVNRINAGAGVRALAPFRPATWERVAEVLLAPLLAHDADAHARMAVLFAKAWRHFADDFTNETRSREYNSLKHGFRVQPSAFKINLTHEDGQMLLQSDSSLVS